MTKFRILIVILVLAAAMRLPIALRMINWPGFDWRWGGEMALIANSIALGDGFSSPYSETPTGPTALEAPVFPWLFSVLMRISDSHLGAARTAIFLNTFWSSLVIYPVAAIGNRLIPGKGAIFALAWAFAPVFGYSDVTYLWNTSLYTLIFAILYWATLELNDSLPGLHFFGYGLLAGFSLLVDPAHALVLILILGALRLYHRASWRNLAVSSLAIIVIVSPWSIRNSVTFGHPMLIRTGAGLNLYRGLVTEPADGNTLALMSPGRNQAELARYTILGEYEYMKGESEKVSEFARTHLTAVMRHSVTRVTSYWVGVRLREVFLRPSETIRLEHVLFFVPGFLGLVGLVFLAFGNPDSFATVSMAMLVLVFPIPYYFALTVPRYRAHRTGPVHPDSLRGVVVPPIHTAPPRRRVSRHAFCRATRPE